VKRKHLKSFTLDKLDASKTSISFMFVCLLKLYCWIIGLIIMPA